MPPRLVALALALPALALPLRPAGACSVPDDSDDTPDHFESLPASEVPSDGRLLLRVGAGLWSELNAPDRYAFEDTMLPELRRDGEPVPGRAERLDPGRAELRFSFVPDAPLEVGAVYTLGLAGFDDAARSGSLSRTLLAGPPLGDAPPDPPLAAMLAVDNTGPVVVPPYPCGGGYDYHEHQVRASAQLQGDARGARIRFFHVDPDWSGELGEPDAIRDAETGEAEHSWEVAVDPTTERDARCVVAVTEDGAGRLSEPSEPDCRDPVFRGCSSAGPASPTAWAWALLPLLAVRLRREPQRTGRGPR